MVDNRLDEKFFKVTLREKDPIFYQGLNRIIQIIFEQLCRDIRITLQEDMLQKRGTHNRCTLNFLYEKIDIIVIYSFIDPISSSMI